eukprot:7217678-Prymnesium_polylepis.1
MVEPEKGRFQPRGSWPSKPVCLRNCTSAFIQNTYCRTRRKARCPIRTGRHVPWYPLVGGCACACACIIHGRVREWARAYVSRHPSVVE